MIHISIPNHEDKFERLDEKKYQIYNIHVNGAYHANARYSTLFTIHEKLLETFGHRLGNVEFPPKKFWFMDNNAINQRREQLTKYFHNLIQNVDTHSLLERLFLKLQINSFGSTANEVKLELYLPDGQHILLPCQLEDNSELILKKIGRQLNIASQNLGYFGLFLTRDRFKEEGKTEKTVFDQMSVRWLKNFESPFISLQLMNRAAVESKIEYRVCLRKIIWDPAVEEPLLDDPAITNRHPKRRLQNFTRRKNQIGRIPRTKPIQTIHALLPLTAHIGRRQLLFEYRQNGVLSHLLIKSTRIRIWRVSHSESDSLMSFQLDYLVGKDEFNQLTLNTNQAVLISLFLQSIASEILRDMGRTSPGSYKFNDEVQSKALENLENSKANSIISDEYSVFDSSAGSDNGSVYSNGDAANSLFKVISHQMPFDNENFSDITDADL
ncbi:PX domain-containing protein [Aphelenchoides bicaudatus]|nr:PX domain-containing protein [Aphelenchoides bicaudatus]